MAGGLVLLMRAKGFEVAHESDCGYMTLGRWGGRAGDGGENGVKKAVLVEVGEGSVEGSNGWETWRAVRMRVVGVLTWWPRPGAEAFPRVAAKISSVGRFW